MDTVKSDIPVIEESTGEPRLWRDFNSLYSPPSSEPVRMCVRLGWTGKTEVCVTGEYSDLIDVISNRALVWRDYVRNDSTFTGSDILGNDLIITARAGRNNDLLALYGLVYEGASMAKAVDVLRFYIRDGRDISVEVGGQEVFVTYGNQKDLRTRFVYSEATGWYRSPGNNRGHSDFPPATEKVASERMPK